MDDMQREQLDHVSVISFLICSPESDEQSGLEGEKSHALSSVVLNWIQAYQIAILLTSFCVFHSFSSVYQKFSDCQLGLKQVSYWSSFQALLLVFLNGRDNTVLGEFSEIKNVKHIICVIPYLLLSHC